VLRRAFKFIFWLSVLLLGIIFLIGYFPRLITRWHADSRLFTPDSAPPEQVAIVFGAGLWRDGSPSPVLRDRVSTAAELYFSGKVEKLLMSGDNSSIHHDEPGAMRDYALSLGVPASDIVPDYAGRRTYDTCYRAREIFHVDSAILVTQAFHLPRALYTCNTLGVNAVGVPADLRQYRQASLAFWNFRETIATVVALWEVHFSLPEPILGNPEPIFFQEAQ
jgi:SanA protein